MYISLNTRYTVDKLDKPRSFSFDMSVNVCIDSSCETITVLSQWLISLTSCSSNGTLTLPGGSIDGFLLQLAGDVTDEAVELVLDTLGVKVSHNQNKFYQQLFLSLFSLVVSFWFSQCVTASCKNSLIFAVLSTC